jgi:hypothetical protein
MIDPLTLVSPRCGLVEPVGIEPTSEMRSTKDSTCVLGAPGRHRTSDLRFTKPLLYQLSYKRETWGRSYRPAASTTAPERTRTHLDHCVIKPLSLPNLYQSVLMPSCACFKVIDPLQTAAWALFSTTSLTWNPITPGASTG